MKIVIVGGGTAGWITALYAKKFFPEHEITLIESESIGILGAGEGTTPNFLRFLQIVDIPIEDLFKYADATIKNGIKFSGWNPEQNFYYPFPVYSGSAQLPYYFLDGEFPIHLTPIIAKTFGNQPKEYDMTFKMCEKNVVPLVEQKAVNQVDYLQNFNNVGEWSVHFNAKKLAEMLKYFGKKRGVQRIEGLVQDFKTNDNGDIVSVVVDDYEVSSDFVFDCSGFARLIVGNFYESEWISHHNSLPANRAISFFEPMTEEIPPYTEAIAMNYGWMWKIPTQERFGCGYVFDSRYISDNDAIKEIFDTLGHEVKISKIFSFDAGFYNEVWKNNVVAVGLSAGFIEPLEATSIWQSIRVLERFFGMPSNIRVRGGAAVDNFNKFYKMETETILSFLYMHYITKRDDTDFWKNFTKNNKMPETVKNILEVIKERPLVNNIDFQIPFIFSEYDYASIMYGNDLIPKEICEKYILPSHEINYKLYEEVIKSHKDSLEILPSHNYVIESVLSKISDDIM